MLLAGTPRDARVMRNDSCREDGTCHQTELGEGSAWVHGVHPVSPDSGKDRYMHPGWMERAGSFLPMLLWKMVGRKNTARRALPSLSCSAYLIDTRGPAGCAAP